MSRDTDYTSKPGTGLEDSCEEEPALGHNPFDSPRPARDPYLEALRRIQDPGPGESPPPLPREERSASQWLATLGLSQWLEDDERTRIASLERGAGDPDRFGLSTETLANVLPLLRSLHRHYFRVTSHGHTHVPAKGPAVLVCNHAGLLPFDAAMILTDMILRSRPTRLPRAIVDRWVDTMPFIRDFFAEMGQVIGTRENFSGLLDAGELVLVFPEGIAGVRKPYRERYRLQAFHRGFVEEALRSQAPIIPTAVVGSDDQAPILYDVKPLARWLGLPVAPITPTFPWLGLLGLLPYPIHYRIVYGEPISPIDEYGPAAADDPAVVADLCERVRQRIQEMLDRERAERRGLQPT